MKRYITKTRIIIVACIVLAAYTVSPTHTPTMAQVVPTAAITEDTLYWLGKEDSQRFYWAQEFDDRGCSTPGDGEVVFSIPYADRTTQVATVTFGTTTGAADPDTVIELIGFLQGQGGETFRAASNPYNEACDECSTASCDLVDSGVVSVVMPPKLVEYFEFAELNDVGIRNMYFTV